MSDTADSPYESLTLDDQKIQSMHFGLKGKYVTMLAIDRDRGDARRMSYYSGALWDIHQDNPGDGVTQRDI